MKLIKCNLCVRIVCYRCLCRTPYTLTENKGVCSSCAEFFNVINPDSRKLVRSCPGSIVFGGAPRDKYVDVKVAV